MRPLRRSISIVSVLFFAALSLILSFATYRIYTSTMLRRYQKQMTSIVDYVEQHIDHEDMSACAQTYVESEKYKEFQTPNAHGFELTLTLKNKTNTAKTPGVAGNDIKIEFFGKLNNNAVIGLNGNVNTSKLQYSNTPDSSDTSKWGSTPDDKVVVFTYELDVNKVDGATSASLQGAEFVLTATDGTNASSIVIVTDSGYVSGWYTNETAQQIKTRRETATSAANESFNLVSDSTGLFKIKGLDDGHYTLTEVRAPTGYNILTNPIALYVEGNTIHTQNWSGEHASDVLTKLDLTVDGTKTSGDLQNGLVETTVQNNSGATLPSTGGIGTTIFYVAGSVMVLAAAILLITKRRMGAND